MNEGTLTVISGPSGAGKGTVIKKLLEGGGAALSVSCTTRQPRAGEQEGVNYYFKKKQEFLDMIERGEFLEYAQVFGNYYGTPRENALEKMRAGRHVVLEIDVQGAMQVKKNYDEALLIFLAPPSLKELLRRLAGRGTESAELVRKRFMMAKDEIAYAGKYDYVVLNDSVERAASVIASIMDVSRYRAGRSDVIDRLLNEEVEI